MPERLGEFLKRWLVTTLAVLVADLLLPGIRYDVASALFLASLLLGFLNAFVRPLLVALSLPFVILTLGLGLWVINALLLLMVGSVIRGFHVDGFGSALLGSLVISLTSGVLNALLGGSRVEVRRTRPPKDRDTGGGPVIDV